MPLANVFYSGPLASGATTTPVLPNNSTASMVRGLGSLGQTVASLMTYDPNEDPKRQQAGYYKAEAEKTAADTARQATHDAALHDAGQSLVYNLRGHPERASDALQDYFTQVSPYLKDPKDFTSTAESLAATLPPAYRDSVLVPLMAASGHALTNEQATSADMHNRQVNQIDATKRYGSDQELTGKEYAADRQKEADITGHQIAGAASRYGADTSAGATVQSATIGAGQRGSTADADRAEKDKLEHEKLAQAALPVTITSQQIPAQPGGFGFHPDAPNAFLGFGTAPTVPAQSVKTKTTGKPPQKLKYDPSTGRVVPK